MFTLPVVVAGVAVVAVLLWAVAAYNRLVLHRNRQRNAFAQIDVQLKRRHDLIPNLVESARGYMAHERSTLEAVIAARNAAASMQDSLPHDLAIRAGAENALVAALGRFRILVENYPSLKADQTALRLMEELTTTENRIAFARQAYNDAVMAYNTRRDTFPTSLVAGLLGFAQADLFEVADASEREAVAVKLS